MKKEYQKVSLDRLLSLKRRPIEIEVDQDYAEIGIYCFGKGIFHKLPRKGIEVGDKELFLIKENDFILQVTFAWEGAVAVASIKEDGMYGSTRFPTFRVNESVCMPKYLVNYFKTEDGVSQLVKISPGSAGRNRVLSLRRINEVTVPLPPLEEQKRIVTRIEELTVQIQEAYNLRQQAAQEAEMIMAGEERKIWPDAILQDAPILEELTKYLARGRQSEQGESDHFLIKTQHVQQGHYIPTAIRLAKHIASKVRTEAVVKDGDILVACSAAGCLGRVARYRDDGKTASTDTHVAIVRANNDIVDPDYLYAYLRGAQGQYQIRSRERGDWQREKIGFRLTELNLNDLRKVPVPLPSISEQRKVVLRLDALQMKVDELKRLHKETAAELNALLPSILDKAFKGALMAEGGSVRVSGRK